MSAHFYTLKLPYHCYMQLQRKNAREKVSDHRASHTELYGRLSSVFYRQREGRYADSHSSSLLVLYKSGSVSTSKDGTYTRVYIYTHMYMYVCVYTPMQIYIIQLPSKKEPIRFSTELYTQCRITHAYFKTHHYFLLVFLLQMVFHNSMRQPLQRQGSDI